MFISESGRRPKRFGCGYYTFEVDSFEHFVDNVAPLFVSLKRSTAPGTNITSQDRSHHEYVWRGMQDPAWSLQSSLSRFASEVVTSSGVDWQKQVAGLTIRHLREYINHLRGLGLLTREHDDLHREMTAALDGMKATKSFHNVFDRLSVPLRALTLEIFSLGQHHGLKTPFLDWTYAPLIALYFAFEERDSVRPEGVGHRVVFALNKTIVQEICPRHEIHDDDDIRFLWSMAHDNPRIIGQSGLFTWVPAHKPVDQWVVEKCEDPERRDQPVLLRFLIRNQRRQDCLDRLSSLNIHARTVYPDRFGAASHANNRFEYFAQRSSGGDR